MPPVIENIVFLDFRNSVILPPPIIYSGRIIKTESLA